MNGGSSQGLFLFEVVETDNGSVCEAFFHRLLSTRRIERGGGREFFEMDSEEHMRQTIELFRGMAATLENTGREIAEFEKAECTTAMVEPIASDQELSRELQAVEMRLLEIKEETEYLNFKKEVIENQLKQRIGLAQGIRGIATWKTSIRRNFSQELLRQRDPNLYEQLLERFRCLDTKAWREQQPGHYKQIQTTYFVPAISRKFEILRDS